MAANHETARAEQKYLHFINLLFEMFSNTALPAKTTLNT
jgi:hypothetical protein